ncbi:MAG TPA: SRPBCC domain-containing protein, partial [Chitinophagaceae bacterium]|nr:SRPBCC domain-containing protein [Chitinophagaceae bacterium]
MKKLKFTTTINAPREKVWDVLWNDDSYRAWTSAFAEGSYAKTDNWKEGSKVLFLGPEGDGMVSSVAKNKPNEYMSFQHLGEVKNGVEDTTSEKVQAWAGAMENYTLKENDGKTSLLVEMDSPDDFGDYFSNTFPKALEKVKELA